MHKAKLHFHSDRQNFFQLAVIQSASLGLSLVGIGDQLSLKFGAGTAICSIFVGNLILWLVGIAIISMVDKSNSTAIDNVRNYLGRWGGLLAAVIIMFAFLNWFSFQISSSLEAVNSALALDSNVYKKITVRGGAVLGLITALFSIGGIRLLKMMTVFGFPFIVIYYLYAIGNSNVHPNFEGTWNVSLPVVLATVLSLLPGVINFPTFFRHSRSRAHSYFALTVLTVLITLFEISTIWMDFSFLRDQGSNVILFSGFVVFVLILCNFLNIYLASACWEAIVPRFGGAKGFAIIGLCGTLTYTFVQISTPVQFLQDLTNAYIANLGVVLLMAFLMRIVIKHRPRHFDRLINLVTWLFGCVAATVYESQHFLEGVDSFIVGVNASILFYMCVVFVEETVWAVRMKLKKAS